MHVHPPLTPPFYQVLPDFKHAALVTLEDATDEESALLLQERQAFQSALRQYVAWDTVWTPEAMSYYRRAMAWWMKALNHALKVCVGAGLQLAVTSGSGGTRGGRNAGRQVRGPAGTRAGWNAGPGGTRRERQQT